MSEAGITNEQAALNVLRRLNEAGFTAYFAGGCVRDMLLKRVPKDYDIATDATPQQIEKVFRRTVSVGAKFGVVLVLEKDWQIDVATFRTDGGYSDGRRPDTIEFTDPQTDASRRDFTINGMFYDPIKQEVIDYVGGQEDIKKKVIRTIGSPLERFNEDYLRMLRAVRFSAELEFEIDLDTFSAIGQLAHNIKEISAERIALELEKIFNSPNPWQGIMDLCSSTLAEYIFPAGLNLKAPWFKLLLSSRGSLTLVEGVLMLYSDNPNAGIALANKLKLSNNQIAEVKWCYANLGKLLDTSLPLHELRPLFASEFSDTLIALELAILKAYLKAPDPVYDNILRRTKYKGEPDMPPPLLTGNDLMAQGVAPGPRLGELMKELYRKQLDMELRTREDALKALSKMLPFKADNR